MHGYVRILIKKYYAAYTYLKHTIKIFDAFYDCKEPLHLDLLLSSNFMLKPFNGLG